MSKVTSICGPPLGIGGKLSIAKSPKKWFSCIKLHQVKLVARIQENYSTASAYSADGIGLRLHSYHACNIRQALLLAILAITDMNEHDHIIA